MIPPIISPLMPPRLDLGSIPNVVPFTMRENYSQMGLVEGMRHWIVTDLVPFINLNIDKLSAEWVEQVNKYIAEFEGIVTDLVTQFNGAVGAIGTSVEEAQAAKRAAEAARDLAQMFASQAQTVQDEAVTTIVSDEDSQFRAALAGLYAPLAGYVTLYDTVTTGRLSNTTLAAAFDEKADKLETATSLAQLADSVAAVQGIANGKADGSVQQTVEQGRLSSQTMGDTWATKASLEGLSTSVASIPKNGFPILVPGKNYKTMACTIRRVSETQWEALDDEGHRPIGLASVTMTPTYIQLTTDFQGVRVGSVAVTPDEAFSKAAVRVGASVGLSQIRVFCYMGAAGSDPVNPGLLSAAGANIWVYGVWEV